MRKINITAEIEESEPTEKEIKETVKHTRKVKTPRTDNLPVEFWKIVKLYYAKYCRKTKCQRFGETEI